MSPGAPTGADQTRPSYDGGGLASLPATICRILDVPVDDLCPPLSPDRLPSVLCEGVRLVVVVIADGLGADQLDAALARKDVPHLAALCGGSAGTHRSTITSVFPSSTIPALASFATGLGPGRHGLTGWVTSFPDRGGPTEVVSMTPLQVGSSSGHGSAPAQSSGDPRELLRCTTLHERLAQHGVESVVVAPEMHRNSPLSRMIYGGVTYLGYDDPDRMIEVAAPALEAQVGGRSRVVHCYHPTVDKLAHQYGPRSDEQNAAIRGVDLQLGALRSALAGRRDALVLITADHGHVATDPALIVDLAPMAPLGTGLRALPSGERRVVYLEAGTEGVGPLRARLEAGLRGIADVLTVETVLARGWFGPGPVAADVRARMGDLVLVVHGPQQLVYRREGATVPLFKGDHAAVWASEMLVPLLAFRP